MDRGGWEKTPKAFFDAYQTEVEQVNRNNYLDFIV